MAANGRVVQEAGYGVRRKIALTVVVTILIALLGVAYQYYYLEERGEYERAIREHYLKSYGRKLEPGRAKHLAILALDRYGPTEFYRHERDYEVLFVEADA